MYYRLILVAVALLFAANVLAQQTDDIEPGVNTSATTEEAPAVEVTASTPSRAIDSLSLDTSQITGNQELPQVLYIVPWKASDLGDLVGRPVNTLLDEVLAPADREVLKRQISYYEDLHGDDADEGSK
ncbi:MAG: hypothetical protein AAF004_03940 [Pseudomonadota bacterium]